MREFRARSRSTRAILSCSSPCCVRWFGHAVLSQKNVGKQTKAAVNVLAKKYCLAKDIARAVELLVGSTVCRVHWDEIYTEEQQQVLGSIPRENHSRGLRKQRIPTRLFAVLDVIGATCHGYKPGTK